jgi:hypothetical protein
MSTMTLGRPGFNNLSENALKFQARENARREKKAQKLKAERMALFDDSHFDRNHYIPLSEFNNFLTNPKFDINYYHNDSYKQRAQLKNEISEFCYNLLNNFTDNYIYNMQESSNNMFYKSLVFVPNEVNLRMIEDVLKASKLKFGKDHYNPFSKKDYNFGEHNFECLDYEGYENDIEQIYEDEMERFNNSLKSYESEEDK